MGAYLARVVRHRQSLGSKGAWYNEREAVMMRTLKMLLQDEERAANVLVWGTCAVGAAAFVAALLAMFLLH